MTHYKKSISVQQQTAIPVMFLLLTCDEMIDKATDARPNNHGAGA